MDQPRTRTRFRRKLALALLCTLAAGALLEGLLRLAGFTHFPAVVPPIVWNSDEDRNINQGVGMFVADTAQLWVPRPGAPVAYGTEQGERINAAGYRGPLRAERREPGTVRVVALGDSSTFGMGVPYADTWCAQLEGELAAGGMRAEVIDAGVIGFTIEQGLERYDALVRPLAPDVVIAAFGAINEHLWAQTMADRPKIDARKRTSARDVLLAVRNKLRLLHLAGWVIDTARGEDREALREKLKEERRKQDAFNVGAGRPDWPGVRRVSLERFAAAHDELVRRVREGGAELILVSMPREPVREVESPVLPLYNEAVEAAAARAHAGFFDARLKVAEDLQGPPAREWSELFIDAYHPNRAGHALIAKGLAPLVKSLAEARRASSPASAR